jgi:hypothetical protein
MLPLFDTPVCLIRHSGARCTQGLASFICSQINKRLYGSPLFIFGGFGSALTGKEV